MDCKYKVQLCGSGEHLLGGRPLLFLGGEGVAGGGVNTIEGEVTR